MRSAVFKGVGLPLSIDDVPEPVPGPGQAVIRVGRCGICGSDLHMTSGGPVDVPVGTHMGHEYAGEVVALGAGCERLRVGDRVTALPMKGCGHCPACLSGAPFRCAQIGSMAGGFGDYTLVEDRFAFVLPASLSLADGALIEPLASALRGVAAARIDPGARVLVMGAGALGAAAIFWARRLGAGRIGALARTDRKAALAHDMGADVFVTTGDDLPGRVTEALGGLPDVIVECIGVPGATQMALDLIRPMGTIAALGGCPKSDSFLPVVGMWKEARMIFSAAYDTGNFRVAIDTMDSGAMEPRAMVTDVIGLDALPDTFEALRAGSAQCKVQVDPMLAA